MNLLRAVAVVLLATATASGFGWVIHLSAGHTVAFVAAGLLCYVLSTIEVGPAPPLR